MSKAGTGTAMFNIGNIFEQPDYCGWREKKKKPDYYFGNYLNFNFLGYCVENVSGFCFYFLFFIFNLL